MTDEQLKTFYTKHTEQLEKQWNDLVEARMKSNVENNSANEFKTSLENLISNNKALMTIPAPSTVALVALQQVVEAPVAPAQQANSTSNANSTSSTTQPPTAVGTASPATTVTPPVATAQPTLPSTANPNQPSQQQPTQLTGAQYPGHQGANPANQHM